jgi:hypothetical protein
MAMGGMAHTGMTAQGMTSHAGMSSAHRGAQQHASSSSESGHSAPAQHSQNMPPCAHCTGQVLACAVSGRVTFVSATALTAVISPVVIRVVVVQEPESTPVVVASTPPPLPDIFAQKQSLLI